MWEIREGYDPEYMGGGMGYRHGSEYEQGFEEGCEHGYKKAMKEMRMMGMRGNGQGMQDGSYGRGNMGNSRYLPTYPSFRDDDYDDDDEMNERRRRRDSRGRYM